MADISWTDIPQSSLELNKNEPAIPKMTTRTEKKEVLPELYPLRFKPTYKQYIWGGWKFATLLNRHLPADENFAESWEICDHGSDQSVVEGGPLDGETLHSLCKNYGRRLVGDVLPANYAAGQFPLLLKYLDAEQNLSLQVHPGDAMASRLNPPEKGKTEAWYVVAAVPGSIIYAGLKPGVDKRTLAEALEKGRCEECLHYFEARRGDCVFIPAGTVHSLGSGILVAEIQETSDVTFRLFDWNRVGADGRPRQLHIEQGLEAIDFARGPISPIRCAASHHDDSVSLVSSRPFNLDRRVLFGPQQIGGDGRFHIITVMDGAVSIEGDRLDGNLCCGQTALLPAELGVANCTPCLEATVLDAYIE